MAGLSFAPLPSQLPPPAYTATFPTAIGTPMPTPFEVIVERVKKQECILFLGAGVHAPPPEQSQYDYPEHQRPALGGALSRHLAQQCKFAAILPHERPTNLQRVALCYEIAHSRDQLVREIHSQVQQGKEPSPALRGLADLPFKWIITTNYDRLYETALSRCEAHKTPFVTSYNPDEHAVTRDFKNASADTPFLYKIHGDILEPKSMVITDEDYIHFILRMRDKENHHPVPDTFQYMFKLYPTLFVGYSLLDYNLRLLFQTLRWKVDPGDYPHTYSVDPYPDPLVLDVMQDRRRHVTFIAEDVWSFVPNLYREVMGKEMPS